MFVLENWGVGGNALWVSHRLENALQVYFLWDDCIPVSLHPYCCSVRHSLSLGPACPTCEPHTAEEPLVLIFVTFTPSINTDWRQKLYEAGLRGNSCFLIWCISPLGKNLLWLLFMQGFLKSLCFGLLVPHQWREENMSFCCSDLWKMPSKMLWKICSK